MIKQVADILKSKVDDLQLFPTVAGLVTVFEKPRFITGADGSRVQNGTDVFPIACDGDMQDETKYSYYIPESERGGVCFFTEAGPTNFVAEAGAKGGMLEYSFILRFLAWYNLESAAIARCSYDDVIIPVMIKQFYGTHISARVRDSIHAVHVTGVSVLQKQPEIFNPFTFVANGRERGLFIAPYDYFGLQITGTFILKVGCVDCNDLPTFTPGAITKRK
jgi:hypothetical protein